MAASTSRVTGLARLSMRGGTLTLETPRNALAVERLDTWSAPLLGARERELGTTFDALLQIALALMPEATPLSSLPLPGHVTLASPPRTVEEDAVAHLLVANTHDWALFFTDRGRVFSSKVHQVPDASRQAKGMPIINLEGVQVESGERVLATITLPDFEPGHNLVMATVKGMVKKTAIEKFERVRSTAPGVSTCERARWSARAPVGQVWTHWPQKVHAESLSTPPNSVVICVSNPRFMMEMA